MAWGDDIDSGNGGFLTWDKGPWTVAFRDEPVKRVQHYDEAANKYSPCNGSECATCASGKPPRVSYACQVAVHDHPTLKSGTITFPGQRFESDPPTGIGAVRALAQKLGPDFAHTKIKCWRTGMGKKIAYHVEVVGKAEDDLPF